MSPTALVLALSLQTTTPVAADDLSWMSGYWLSCDDGREASETWSDPRGGMMLGSALTLANGEASFEAARIAPLGTGVAYYAQPGGAPATPFAAIETAGTRVVFENRDNDFPRRVIYHRTGDVMTARIEGRMDGREQSMDWRFHKADLNARCPS